MDAIKERKRKRAEDAGGKEDEAAAEKKRAAAAEDKPAPRLQMFGQREAKPEPTEKDAPRVSSALLSKLAGKK